MTRRILGCTLAFCLAAGVGCSEEKLDSNAPDGGTTDSGDGGSDLPDAGPDPFALEEPHAGGSPSAIAISGGRAYLTIGAHLEIWDLKQGGTPALLGRTGPLRGMLSAVAVEGERAYVAERGNLDSVIRVFNVADPAAPVEVASFRTVPEGTVSMVHGLTIASGKLYVADLEQGIAIFELTNPEAPGTPRILPNPGVTSVSVAGTRLYYEAQGFAGGWFGIIDIAADYQEIGGTSLSNVKGSRFVNDLLVTIGTEGIVAYRFNFAADPWSGIEVFRLENVFGRAVAGAGTTAWIPAFDGLHVLDISDPAAIVHTGPVAMPTIEGDAVAVADGLLTLATRRGLLLTIDVGSPTAPVAKSTQRLSVCTNCTSLTTTGDGSLFIADMASGLRTSRVRDLGELGRATVADTQVAMEDVVVSGGLAFVSDWFHGLRIFDVSNPAEPTLLSSLDTGGHASAVAIDATRLVVGESTNGGRIHVIDVSDPAAPVILGSATTSKVRDLQLVGNLVFVADESILEAGGLRVFDITDPQSIELVAHYAVCRDVVDVAVADSMAAIACASEGYHFIDVTDPAHPALLSSWNVDRGESANSVALDGTRAYLGQTSIVSALDLGDRTAPEVLVSWPIASPAWTLTVPVPGRVIAACGQAGLYQWKLE